MRTFSELINYRHERVFKAIDKCININQPNEHGTININQPNEHGTININQPNEHGTININQPNEHGTINMFRSILQ